MKTCFLIVGHLFASVERLLPNGPADSAFFFFNRIGFPFLSWASTLDPFPCLCHSFPSLYARTWCVACFALCTTAVTLVVTIVFEVAVGVLTVAVIDNGCGRHVVLISILTSLSLLCVSINHESSEHELIMLWSTDWPGAVSSCHVHRALKHQRQQAAAAAPPSSPTL